MDKYWRRVKIMRSIPLCIIHILRWLKASFDDSHEVIHTTVRQSYLDRSGKVTKLSSNPLKARRHVSNPVVISEAPFISILVTRA